MIRLRRWDSVSAVPPAELTDAFSPSRTMPALHLSFHVPYYYFVSFRSSGRKTCCSANRSTARENASPGRGHSAGQVRDLAWTRPSEAFSRLSPESRRSQGSLPQHVSDLCARTESDKGVLVRGPERFNSDRRRRRFRRLSVIGVHEFLEFRVEKIRSELVLFHLAEGAVSGPAILVHAVRRGHHARAMRPPHAVDVDG